MFKSLIAFTACFLTALSSFCLAESCSQSVEFGVGWRRDNLNWKLKNLESSYISADVDSHLRFKDLDMYTVYGKAKWIGEAFYVRLSADYGLTDKGRAKERFHIDSPYFYDDITVFTSDPVKRRSEVYDFDGAVGYPFVFNNCCLNIIPLIGFSFHRQHLRVKSKEDCSSCSSSYFSIDSSSSSSSSYSTDPFAYTVSSNPFSSPSDPRIASSIGLSTDRETSSYRFTWYGFYLGTDIAYALDSCWTLYGEFEGHFLNRCHRKRDSITGVYFVDDYHHEGWAYGFNVNIGTTVSMSNCWYATFSIDYKWWKGHSSRDELHWQSVGANAALAYSF